MKKILVIGCPGSGKSTFARKLQKICQIPVVYLDRLYWNEDKTTVERDVFILKLKEALEMESFIIDGNYLSSMPLRLEACDTVFFLDYQAELCLESVRLRMGTPRPDMPWVETEEDAEFMEFIRDFSIHSRGEILKLLEKHREKNIFVFKTREEADSFLKSLKTE